MSSGLGQSSTTFYNVHYYDYYNAFKAVATSPAQLAALASLGAAPANGNSGNPVNGSTLITISSAEGRNLGFNTPGATGPGGTFDSVIGLNTSLTSPPNGLNSNTYSLQSVATHEIDEVLRDPAAWQLEPWEQRRGRRSGPLPLFRARCPQLHDQSECDCLLLHQRGHHGPDQLQSSRRWVRLRRLGQQCHSPGPGRVRHARFVSNVGLE